MPLVPLKGGGVRLAALGASAAVPGGLVVFIVIFVVLVNFRHTKVAPHFTADTTRFGLSHPPPPQRTVFIVPGLGPGNHLIFRKLHKPPNNSNSPFLQSSERHLPVKPCLETIISILSEIIRFFAKWNSPAGSLGLRCSLRIVGGFREGSL